MNDDAFDTEIREALEPDAATIDRVVRGALARDDRRPVYRALSLVTVAVAVVIIAAVLLRTFDGRHDVPAHERVAAGVIHMTNVHDTVVVRPASGGVWLVGGSRQDMPLPPGTIVVHTPGEVR